MCRGAAAKRRGSALRSSPTAYRPRNDRATRRPEAPRLTGVSSPAEADVSDEIPHAHLPGEWSLKDLGWLLKDPWLTRVYPPFAARRTRLLANIQAALATQPALAGPTLAIVGSVLSHRPGARGTTLAPLAERLLEIRVVADTDPLALVHCLIVALDVHSRFADANPVRVALQAVRWNRVPAPFVAPVVALAQTLLAWREAAMTGKDHALHCAALQLDGQTMDVQLSSLATAAASLAGASASPGWWRDAQAQGAPIGTCTLAPGNAYLFAIIQVVGPDDPAALPLYEAYADLCAANELRHVEPAALALARRAGAGEGEVLLRAALRAHMREDTEHASARAQAAFACLPAADGAARAFAATLAGLSLAPREPLAAHAWLTTAIALSNTGPPPFQGGLLAQLAGLAERLGDVVGVRRARDALQALDLPARKPPVISNKRRPIIPNVEHSSGPHPDFDVHPIRRMLDQGLVDVAYRYFSEAMVGLLELHTPASAIDVLEPCRLVFEAELSAARKTGDWLQRRVPATLTSWTCAALADLHELTDDFAGWSRNVQRQLELEDHEHAARESGDRDSMFEWLSSELGIDAEEQTVRCIHAANTALAAGQTAKAKFWMARAQHYRALVQKY